jgi:hypothetical protein
MRGPRSVHQLPSNVAWFERLMYLSLGIGLIEGACDWRAQKAMLSRLGYFGEAFVLLCLVLSLAFSVLLIWLTARRHKN